MKTEGELTEPVMRPLGRPPSPRPAVLAASRAESWSVPESCPVLGNPSRTRSESYYSVGRRTAPLCAGQGFVIGSFSCLSLRRALGESNHIPIRIFERELGDAVEFLLQRHRNFHALFRSS